MQPERLRSQRGIGPGELLLIAASATLLVAAAASRLLPDTQTSATVLGALQTVDTYLQLARVEAVARERPCTLRLDATDGRLAVFDSLGALLHERRLPPNVRALEGAAVEFRPDGTANPALITLADERAQAWIAVEPSSRIRSDLR